jgi:regulator of cell morphogenesis and NO signaling
MSSVDHEPTLADLATSAPGSAHVLERFGLDYCCGGRRTLSDACHASGVDVAELLEALADVVDSPAPDWADLGPAALADHIEATHHAYLHEALPHLGSLVVKVREAHGRRHPELVDVARVFEDLRADFVPHLFKEERVLFPMIRQLEAGKLAARDDVSLHRPISMMIFEHEQGGEVLSLLHELTDGYQPPEDACASYRALYAGLAELEADTHLHLHKENNLLFRAVLALERGERA